MASQVDLNHLIQQLSKLTTAIENSSASSSSYSTRAGRGGNSNGKTASASGGEANADAIKAAEARFAKAIRRNSEDVSGWTEAIRAASGITKLMGETEKQAIVRIQATNREQTAATEKVTESMFRMVKVSGLQSDIVKRSNAAAFGQLDAMQRVSDKHDEMVAAAADRIDVEAKIAANEKAFKLTRSETTKKALLSEKAELTARLASIKTQAEYDAEMKNLRDEMEAMAKQIDTQNNPAFQDLSDATNDVVHANASATLEINKLKSAIKELTPNVNAQGNTTRRMTDDATSLSDAMQKGKAQIVAAAVGIAKGLLGATVQYVKFYREQLKYNVDESDYLGAEYLGMSDGERSKLLGSNVDAFRGMTGSANNREIMDSGALSKMMKTALESYGESGLEAGELIAKVIKNTQQSGVNVRGNPELVTQRMERLSEMADQLGMVKTDLIDFSDQLASSGDLAFMSMKYNGLSAKAQSEAVDREIGARLLNAKIMGVSNDQLKARIQAERALKNGSLESIIKGRIGSAYDMSIGQKLGVNLSKEDRDLYAKRDMVTDPKDLARIADIERQFTVAAAFEQNKARMAGNEGKALQIAAFRGIGSPFTDTLSDSKTNEALQQTAASKGTWTQQELDNYTNKGIIPKGLLGDGRAAKTANSERLLADQTVNKAVQVYEGFMKDPLAQTAMNTAAMVVQLGAMLLQGRALGTLLGGAGRAAGGAAAAAGGTAAGGAAAGGARAALASVAKFAGPLIAGAGAIYTANTMTEEEMKYADGNPSSAAEAMTRRVGTHLGSMLTFGALSPSDVGAFIDETSGTKGEGYTNTVPLEQRGWFRNLVNDPLVAESPSSTLERSMSDAQKIREESDVKPLLVQVTGAEAEAIRATSIAVSKSAELDKANLQTTQKKLSTEELRKNAMANMQAKMQNINSTTLMYQNTDL